MINILKTFQLDFGHTLTSECSASSKPGKSNSNAHSAGLKNKNAPQLKGEIILDKPEYYSGKKSKLVSNFFQ